MPAWSVAEDEARLLGMPLPQYLDWAATEDGARWLTRLRIKWAVVDEARRRDTDAQAAAAEEAMWRRAGWYGGPTEPEGEAREVEDDDAA